MSDTMEQLFENRREKATLLIPKHLKRLAEKTLDFGLNYEILLYKHIIFPLITCLLDKDSFDYTLLNAMDENRKGFSFCINSHYIYPRFLKYCPYCIIDDRDR